MVGVPEKKIIEVLRRWFGRTWLLLAAGWLVFHVFVDMDKMQLKMLNRVVPASMEDFVAFSLDPDNGRPPQWEKYIIYFRTAEKILPKLSAAKGLLGYCYYYMGNMPEAERYYRQAIRLNPRFFWFYYDLGIIYMRGGKYREAQEMLRKATECDPNESIMFINVSKFYRELNKHADSLGYNTEGGLTAGYRSANQVLMFLHYNLPEYADKQYKVRLF